MTRPRERLDPERHAQKSHALDQIWEDESLTADLVDEAAAILLDWSTAQVLAAFQDAGVLSQAELNARLARLRRLLKRISRQAGQAAPDKQAQRVRSLLAGLGSSQEHPVEA
jgi:hypothetical protein